MNAFAQLKPTRSSVSEAEWNARVDLAACYRLADAYGMSELLYTHISARLPQQPNEFLLNAHGMLFSEITASSLLKVDLEGNVADKPELPYGLHQAGFVIHSAIYKARPDVMAVMHTHTISGMAVSVLKCRLLPLTQTSTRFYGRIAYHDSTRPERGPGLRARLDHPPGQHDNMILL